MLMPLEQLVQLCTHYQLVKTDRQAMLEAILKHEDDTIHGAATTAALGNDQMEGFELADKSHPNGILIQPAHGQYRTHLPYKPVGGEAPGTSCRCTH